VAKGENPGQSTKKKRGKPALFSSPRELAEAVDKYFESIKKTKNNLFPDPPTLAALAYNLGFCDRQSLADQEARGEKYSCIIKRAKLFIQAAHEGGLYGTSCAGHIFWLKNHAGYVDAQAVNVHAEGGPFGIYTMSHEDAVTRLAELRAKQDA